MCVIFFLYFTSFFAGQLVVPWLIKNDPQLATLYLHVVGQFFLLAGAINAPILYFCRLMSIKFELTLKKLVF
jgi:hypothetical protein